MEIKKDVKRKINPVCDCLCELCSQNYQDECRAYEAPHSEEERKNRMRDIKPLCEISIFKWGFSAPRRHYC